MLKSFIFTSAIFLVIVLAGCGDDGREGDSMFLISDPTVVSPASRDVYFGQEAYLYPPTKGITDISQTFSLPTSTAENYAVGFQGTISWAKKDINCTKFTEVLMLIFVDGARYFAAIQKMPEPTAKGVRQFIEFLPPIPYGKGDAVLNLQSDGCSVDWEVQARFIIEPQSEIGSFPTVTNPFTDATLEILP